MAVSKDDSTDLANGSRVPEVDLRAKTTSPVGHKARDHIWSVATVYLLQSISAMTV